MEKEFKVPFHCARCGQQGWALWLEETKDKDCLLLALSPGFYERYPRNALFTRTETVCGRCGAVHTEA